MPHSRLSIAWKITLLAGLCLVLVVAALIGAAMLQTQRSADVVQAASSAMLQDAATARVSASAETQALLVRRLFTDTYQYGSGILGQLRLAREQNQSRMGSAFELREDLVRLTRNAYENNPELYGLYLVYEPDGLDQRDALFVDQAEFGGNDAGRFSIYWARTGGELYFETISNELIEDASLGSNGQPYNTWYRCPLDQGRVCVVDPYVDVVDGKSVLLTSLAFPLMVDGKAVGVFGIDLELSSLQGIAAAANATLYDGQGTIGVISTKGMLAAYSADAERLGKRFEAVYAGQPDLLQRIAQARTLVRTQGERIQVVQPSRRFPMRSRGRCCWRFPVRPCWHR